MHCWQKYFSSHNCKHEYIEFIHDEKANNIVVKIEINLIYIHTFEYQCNSIKQINKNPKLGYLNGLFNTNQTSTRIY